jgi:hypothetical protein
VSIIRQQPAERHEYVGVLENFTAGYVDAFSMQYMVAIEQQVKV